jgi:lysophospholipase L1-like esterase
LKDSESPPVKLAGAAGAAESPKGRRAYKIAVLVLAVLLVGSLSLNASLVGLSESYFRRELLVRLDPAGLKAYATDRAKPPASGPVLLFFGDSRAFMWPEPNTPTGYRILNHGISYQTTEQILLRIEEDAVSVHPSVVVLEGGVNDLKTIAELPEQRAQIVADCEANLARIVDRCRQAGATVVLVSVFDIGNVSIWKRPFWSHDVEAAVREVNAFLVGLVGPHVVLFDANRILDDSPGHIAPEYQMDYLHLIPAGYAALNGKLVPLLASLPK